MAALSPRGGTNSSRTSNQFAVFNDIDPDMDIDIDDLALQFALRDSRAELQRASERSGAGAGGAHIQERPPHTPQRLLMVLVAVFQTWAEYPVSPMPFFGI
jgi:hypothetical protein